MRYTVVAIVDMARETAWDERWRGQSKGCEQWRRRGTAAESEKIENGSEFWNLKTCAVKN